MSIAQRLFRLVLLTVILCFVLLEAVSLFGLQDVERRTMENSKAMGESAAEFAEAVAADQTKQRLALLAREKAGRIKNDLSIFQVDTELLAQNMTHILTHRELHRPHRLPIGGETPIASMEPYLYFLPSLRASGQIPAVLPDADIAANSAYLLHLWANSYAGEFQATFFFASELGYIIGSDILSDDAEYVKFYGERLSPSFDIRENPWYKEVKASGNTVFTDVHMVVEGYPAISCIAPYYDEKGFAGVAGISGNIYSLYEYIAKNELEGTGINFILDKNGEVLLSSEESGILAASESDFDLRQAYEQDLALQAQRMVQRQSDVTMVTVAGKEYFLAFAPIHSIGWSFGTLIEKETVVKPTQKVRTYLLTQAEDFNESLRKIFFDNLWRTAIMLSGLLAVLFFFGHKAASRFVQPILALTAGVRDIARGNLDKKLAVRTGDEIEQLADSFNDMTEELKIYIKNLEQTTAEKERILAELDLAAKIQAGILPSNFPQDDRFDIFATMRPAKEVGGDFYDFYFLDDHRLVVTIADVSDKGVPAALFMVRAKTVLESSIVMAEKEGRKLSAAIAMANDKLCENNEEDLFVTVFTALIDLAEQKVTYVNAGHNLPALLHVAQGEDGTVSCIPRGKDSVLAVMDGLEFVEETLQLAPQDALFLYTDGVTEAMNREREMFSKEKMLSTLATLAGKTSCEIVTGVLKAVDNHVAEAEQSDDITMLCIRWNGIRAASTL